MRNHLKTEERQPPLPQATYLTSGHKGATRGWVRHAIPSSPDLVFVILLLGLSTGPLSIGLLGDGGTGWHIRTGEWILNAHAIPRVDLFSTTMQGRPWFAWEWLYDIIVGSLHSSVGLNAVVLFTAFVIALTFALVLKRVQARGASLPVAIVLLLLAFTASTVHFLARPHVLSWLFTLVWIELLETFEAQGNARALFWLPPLMMVWVNLHGGFLVGLMLLGIYLTGDLVSAMLSRQRAANKDALAGAWNLASASIASGLATLANPHGYRLYIHIYQYLGDKFLMKHIQEFLAPNFPNLAQKCFVALILLAVAAVAATRQRMPPRHWLLLLFAIASGLYAVRNIPVSSILIVWIEAPKWSIALHECAKNRELAVARACVVRLDSFGLRMTRFEETVRGHLWPVLATLGAMVLCFAGGSVGAHPLMNAHFDQKRFPLQAVDYLATHQGGEPVFTIDRWGGYLIYRFYPKVVTAVDDRHDLYGADFLKNYLKIIHGEPGWESLMENLHPGWALLPADSPLAGLLNQNPRWKSAYRDETAELFERRSR